MEELLSRFLRYVEIDTQSKDDCDFVPSTEKQHDLAAMLAAELEAMGASRVRYDREHCYVYAEIPANCDAPAPAIGFVAHMDTVEGVSGDICQVHPQVIRDYDGSDILLNEDLALSLRPSDFPELNSFLGKTIITTDGTTVLGADDKAGVAEIMAMAEILLSHPEIRHGKICVGFTPDEEVGNGVKYFDVPSFGADVAYTMDGGTVGELEYENFNAASAVITFQGKSAHPGSAKGKMVNASLLLLELQNMLPEEKKPEYTSGYEGFFHLISVEGNCESAKSVYIIREHDAEKFAAMKEYLADAVQFLNRKYYPGCAKAVIRDSYRNMKDIIVDHFDLITRAKEKIQALGIEPIIRPIRGGTDGATLSYMGLPCPNLGTGGHNYHGRYEYAVLEDMEKSVELLVSLASID